MATQTIFTKIESIVDGFTAVLTVSAVSPQVAALKAIVVTYIGLWVLVRGYLILAGKSDEPFKGLIFDGAVKIIIFIVVFSPTWINLISNAIDSLNSWASGSISLYTRMDEIFTNALELSNKLIDKDSGIFDIPVTGILSAFLVLLGFFIFSVPSILIIITASITLKVLIMLTPIMIFTLMFDWFKKIFERWIELVINNTLTVLLIGIFLNAIDGKYKEIINTTNANVENSDLLGAGSSVLIFSLVIAWVVLMAKGIAKELTYVSIERLPGASAQEGKQLAGSTKKAAVKTIGATSAIARGAGNISARTIRKFRK